MSQRGPTAAVERGRALRALSSAVLLLPGILGLAMPGPSRADAPRLDRLEHFTTRDGLSANWILSIYQDRQGFLWIGTDDGLNRYDGYGFKVFRHDPGNPRSLSDNFVICVYEDRLGQIWFGTRNGLNRLDRARGTFTHFRYDPERPNSLSRDFVPDLQEDRQGNLWVSTFDGLNRFDRATQSFTRFRHDPENPGSLSTNAVVRIHHSGIGDLWIGTGDGVLHRFDPETQRFARHPLHPGGFVWRIAEDAEGFLWIAVRPGALLFRFDPRTGDAERIPIDLDVTNIESLLPRPDGSVWIGTTGGLAIFEPTSATYSFTTHDPSAPGSLSHSRVMRLYEDRSGVVWLGTEEGLDKYVPSRGRFALFDHRPGDPQSLSDNLVSAVAADRNGVLWIGTPGNGLNRLDRARGVNTRYRHDPDDPDSLASDEIWALLPDRRGRLWLGLRNGLDRFDPDRGRFFHYGPGPDDPDRGMVGRIQGLVEDADGTLWVTDDSSLHHLDAEGRPLARYLVLEEPGTPLHGQPVLLRDRRGDLWIGSDFFGLTRFDPRREAFTRYRHDPGDPASLSYDKILSLHQDGSGILWIGTHGGGLNRLDPAAAGEPIFTRYGPREGLDAEQIVGIVEAAGGDLWLSTSLGLVRFDPVRRTFQTFDAADGPGQDAYSWGAAWRDSGGELFFGGTGGVTAFLPEGFEIDSHPPPVAITDFLLFNRSTPLAAHAPAGASNASDDPRLLLNHREYVFAFEFAALHFTRPDRIRYAYRLEDFDRDWVTADPGRRFAQYSNLAPGNYRFRVKAANPDGVWNPDGASVRITVLAPPWKTWWAYALYGLALATAILGYVRSQQRKLERERLVSARLREVDRIKDEFLANTSHELRTPLYGITGLAESLIDGARGEAPEAVKQDLAMIVASGRRLSHLVGDILDFSKMRHRSLVLDRRPLDLKPLVDVVLTLSRPLVETQQLALKNSVPADLPAAEADEKRLQQILHNLVGNAIKFTEAGLVEVSAERCDGRLSVRVSDTGIGISEDQQEKIFDAFEQADASAERRYGGTGLGLAVTRQLVELHGGTLSVESTPGEGSTFSFSLPIAEREPPSPPPAAVAEPAVVEPAVASAGATGTQAPRSEGGDAGHILVVDDEPVNRRVLVNQLTAAGFQVTQTASGPEALARLEVQLPDLILLDVMMPRMSGYEVCRTLRRQHPLDQLPVLFLTARSQPSDLVVGLAAGANDYLPKPIAKSELLARVRTHLALLDVHRRLARLVAERTSQLDERGRLLEERQRLIGQLEATNAELARFNYTVAHDLRNPLVTIKTFIGRLQQEVENGDSEHMRQDLRRIGNAADNLHRLLEELYAFSRADRPPVPCEEVALGELVSETLNDMAGQVAERRVEIEVADGLPVVCGDRARLSEVVRHLLANALGHLGDQPAPRVEVGTRKIGTETAVFVRDNGRGIDPRYHEKVFELFERLDPEDADGTGIGLALVKRIVEVHDGRVWVESEGVGRGSTFCFTLPV